MAVLDSYKSATVAIVDHHSLVRINQNDMLSHLQLQWMKSGSKFIHLKPYWKMSPMSTSVLECCLFGPLKRDFVLNLQVYKQKFTLACLANYLEN